MALYHIEVRCSLNRFIVVVLNSEGYSHPGLEKVYSKAEVDSRGANETDGDSLRQIKDFKVSLDKYRSGF